MIREIGADLTKDSSQPTKDVSDIAIRLFEFTSWVNIEHTFLALNELCGKAVEIVYKPLINYEHDSFEDKEGRRGAIYRTPKEVEKVRRWAEAKFTREDYEEAKEWREFISTIMPVARQSSSDYKVTALEEAKKLAEHWMHEYYRSRGRWTMLKKALERFGANEHQREIIMKRWKASGGASLADFAPYSAYIMLVDLFFDIAAAVGLIGGERQTNRIDLTYVYYLPFTEVFISGDKLHKKIVPLFLNADRQTFIDREDIKTDLKALTNHYHNHPELETEGLIRLAQYPPLEGNFKICNIYDRFCPDWRAHAANPIPITPALEEAIVKLLDHAQNNKSNLSPALLEERAPMIFERCLRSSPNKKGWGSLLRPK